MADKDCDDQIAQNNGNISNGNDTTEMASDKDDEVEKLAKIVENNVVDETSESNEPQPLKKQKCVAAECCPSEAEDEGLKFLRICIP